MIDYQSLADFLLVLLWWIYPEIPSIGVFITAKDDGES